MLAGDGMDDMISYIDRAATEAAIKVWQSMQPPNYYRKTELLLKVYPKLKHLHDHPERYKFLPTDHSHDISVVPAPGTGYRDSDAILDEYIARRKRSFVRTLTRFYALHDVIMLEREDPHFIAVAMYYLNEDEHGNDRGPEAPRLSWDEICERLTDAGIYTTTETLRRWRTEIVREMTVLIFGVEGAKSLSWESVELDCMTNNEPTRGGVEA